VKNPTQKTIVAAIQNLIIFIVTISWMIFWLINA